MPVLQEDLKNPTSKDFPGSSNSKEPACQCRRRKRCKFDPWVGKILWRRKCNPFQYSCWDNPMDRGAWWSTVHGVAKNQIDWATEHTRRSVLLSLIWAQQCTNIWGARGKKSLSCKFPWAMAIPWRSEKLFILWSFEPLKSDPKLNIMLKETFWGSQKGSGRVGILGVHGCCSLQGMPSPRDPCGHTPFMSPPFAAGVHSEILRLGHSGRNNRFRPRRESPGENLGRKRVGGKFLKWRVCCPTTYPRQPQVGGQSLET